MEPIPVNGLSWALGKEMKTFVAISFLIVLIGLSILSFYLVFGALKTGKTKIQGWPEATKKDNPIWFWICVILQGAIGPICVTLAILSIKQ